ncbi:Os03g0189200 [Oryza sativa Japonica Group]|uniref:Os03g0189200 protein n=1 Tax=Oryza sativa subsp. japonica TaxID=39947 RepID=A0A0P0VU43_ORYSJ|nr:Os03g0189200 [Oryza sativa Japonica Group]
MRTGKEAGEDGSDNTYANELEQGRAVNGFEGLEAGHRATAMVEEATNSTWVHARQWGSPNMDKDKSTYPTRAIARGTLNAPRWPCSGGQSHRRPHR